MVADNRPTVRRVLLLTLLLNVLVMVLKAIVGFVTGSLSLLADALHSVTDSANNVLGLVANQISSPEPDRDHPYGHQKYEAVAALMIAAFLGIACFEILKNAFQRIFAPEPTTVQLNAPELWLMLLVLGINIFVAFYERWEGRRVKSPILLADAHHTMSDIWVTIGVMGGLIGIWIWDIQWLDIVMAFPVAAMVLWSGWLVICENLPWLVDEVAIAPEAIYAVAMQVPGVLNCHAIASRGVVGRQTFIEMHLVVNATDVDTAHDITEAVEAVLEDRYGPTRVTIHIEPQDYRSDSIAYAPDHE